MSDTVVIDATGNSETSTTARIATDEIVRNSVTEHQQIMKLSLGADGQSSLVRIGQQPSVSSIPVVIASDQSSLTVSGSVTVLNSSVTIFGSVTVNNQISSVTVNNTSFSTTVLNSSLTISGTVTCQPHSVTVSNSGFNQLNAMPSGTNSIGSVTVLNPSITVSGSMSVNTETSVTIRNTTFSVTVLNQVSSVTVNNTQFSTTVLNTTRSVTVLNPSLIVAGSVSVNTEPSVTVRNTTFSVTILNPTVSVSVQNTVTSVTVNNTQFSVTVLNASTTVSGSVTVLNQITSVTINNVQFSTTVLNPSITTIPGDGWVSGLQNNASLSGAYGIPVQVNNGSLTAEWLKQPTTPSDTQIISGSVTVSNPVSSVTVYGSVTVSNAQFSVTVLNTSTTISGSVTVNNTTFSGLLPLTSGGCTTFKSVDLDETEEEIKSTAGQVFGWYMFNASTSVRFVKFYNATAASTTVGTTVPVITMGIPAGAAANAFNSHGIEFNTAITVASTTGIADNDTGAPNANDVSVNIFYK